MIWLSNSRIYLKQVKAITWGVVDNKKHYHTLTLEKLKGAREARYLAPMELATWKN